MKLTLAERKSLAAVLITAMMQDVARHPERYKGVPRGFMSLVSIIDSYQLDKSEAREAYPLFVVTTVAEELKEMIGIVGKNNCSPEALTLGKNFTKDIFRCFVNDKGNVGVALSEKYLSEFLGFLCNLHKDSGKYKLAMDLVKERLKSEEVGDLSFVNVKRVIEAVLDANFALFFPHRLSDYFMLSASGRSKLGSQKAKLEDSEVLEVKEHGYDLVKLCVMQGKTGRVKLEDISLGELKVKSSGQGAGLTALTQAWSGIARVAIKEKEKVGAAEFLKDYAYPRLVGNKGVVMYTELGQKLMICIAGVYASPTSKEKAITDYIETSGDKKMTAEILDKMIDHAIKIKPDKRRAFQTGIL